MLLETARRPVLLLVTASVAAFSAAAACHGAEPPAAAQAEHSPASRAPGTAQPSATQPTTSNPESAPAACGPMPGDKIEKLRWSFGSGNAECDRLETLWANVPHADLVCKTDDDCTVITSDGNCINLPLSKAATASKQYSKAPCGNPVSGACAGHPNVPKCSGGCCGLE